MHHSSWLTNQTWQSLRSRESSLWRLLGEELRAPLPNLGPAQPAAPVATAVTEPADGHDTAGSESASVARLNDDLAIRCCCLALHSAENAVGPALQPAFDLLADTWSLLASAAATTPQPKHALRAALKLFASWLRFSGVWELNQPSNLARAASSRFSSAQRQACAHALLPLDISQRLELWKSIASVANQAEPVLTQLSLDELAAWRQLSPLAEDIVFVGFRPLEGTAPVDRQALQGDADAQRLCLLASVCACLCMASGAGRSPAFMSCAHVGGRLVFYVQPAMAAAAAAVLTPTVQAAGGGANGSTASSRKQVQHHARRSVDHAAPPPYQSTPRTGADLGFQEVELGGLSGIAADDVSGRPAHGVMAAAATPTTSAAALPSAGVVGSPSHPTVGIAGPAASSALSQDLRATPGSALSPNYSAQVAAADDETLDDEIDVYNHQVQVQQRQTLLNRQHDPDPSPQKVPKLNDLALGFVAAERALRQVKTAARIIVISNLFLQARKERR